MTKAASYDSSLSAHSAMLKQITPPINASHVCHLFRSEGGKSGKNDGISKESIAAAGHWAQLSAMDRFYLSLTLPMDWVRNVAGFPTFPGCFELDRAVMIPTQVFEMHK